jgi:hypothetical protein
MRFLGSSAISTPPQPCSVSTEQPAVSKTGGTRIDAFNEAQLRRVFQDDVEFVPYLNFEVGNPIYGR